MCGGWVVTIDGDFYTHDCNYISLIIIIDMINITAGETGFLLNNNIKPGGDFTNFFKDSSSEKIESGEEFRQIMTEIAQQDILKDLGWPGKIKITGKSDQNAHEYILSTMGFSQFRTPNFAETHHSSITADGYFTKFIQAFENRGFATKKSWLKVPGTTGIAKFPEIDVMNYDAGPKSDIITVKRYMCSLDTQLDSFDQTTTGALVFPDSTTTINIDQKVFELFGYTSFIDIKGIKRKGQCTFDFSINFRQPNYAAITQQNYQQYNIGNKSKKFSITTANPEMQFKLLLVKLLGDGLQPLISMIYLMQNPSSTSIFAGSTHDHFLLLKYLVLGIQVFFFYTELETHASATKKNPNIIKFSGKQKVRYVQRFLMTEDTVESAKERFDVEKTRIEKSNQHILNILTTLKDNSYPIAVVENEEKIISRDFIQQVIDNVTRIIEGMKDFVAKAQAQTIAEFDRAKTQLREQFEILQIVTQTKKNIKISKETKYTRAGPFSGPISFQGVDARLTTFSGYAYYWDKYFKIASRFNIPTPAQSAGTTSYRSTTAHTSRPTTAHIGRYTRKESQERKGSLARRESQKIRGSLARKYQIEIKRGSLMKETIQKLKDDEIKEAAQELFQEYHTERDDAIYISYDTNEVNENGFRPDIVIDETETGTIVPEKPSNDTQGKMNVYIVLFSQIISCCQILNLNYETHFASIYSLLIDYCEYTNEVLYDEKLLEFIEMYKDNYDTPFQQDKKTIDKLAEYFLSLPEKNTKLSRATQRKRSAIKAGPIDRQPVLVSGTLGGNKTHKNKRK
jgi:hypothetical protein